MFIKESSNKLFYYQRDSKQTFCFLNRVQSGFLFIKKLFCLSKRMQAKFLLIKKSPKKLSVYHRIQANFLFKKKCNGDFCLTKRVQENFLFVKENSSKLSAYQRGSKQTFFLSIRMKANFLFIKENLIKLSVYQSESRQTLVQCQLFSKKYCKAQPNFNSSFNWGLGLFLILIKSAIHQNTQPPTQPYTSRLRKYDFN